VVVVGCRAQIAVTGEESKISPSSREKMMRRALRTEDDSSDGEGLEGRMEGEPDIALRILLLAPDDPECRDNEACKPSLR